MKNIILLMLLCLGIKVHATVYYVSPSGDNSTGLSEATAFNTIQQAADISAPGDVINIMNGFYTNPGNTVVKIYNSGTSTNYITYQNYPGHKPTIYFDSWQGINIVNGASYLIFQGLKISGANGNITLAQAQAQNYPGGGTNCYNATPGSLIDLYNGVGILAVGPNLKWSDPSTTTVPHHIEVRGCEVFNCPSSAISFQQADYITISQCKVYNSCWYTLYGTSGINLYQMVNIDGTTTVHNTIYANLIYGIKLLLDPISTSCHRYDGNGIIVDDFRHDQKFNYKVGSGITYPVYSANTLISYNIVTNCGGSGISLYKSNNIFVYNNTVANNGTYLSSWTGGALNPADFACGDFSNIDVQRNIFYSNDSRFSLSSPTNHHAYYLYNSYTGGTPANGTLTFKNNNVFGPSNSLQALPTGSTYTTYDPSFANMDVNNVTPFISACGSKVYSTICSGVGYYDYMGQGSPVGAYTCPAILTTGPYNNRFDNRSTVISNNRTNNTTKYPGYVQIAPQTNRYGNPSFLIGNITMSAGVKVIFDNPLNPVVFYAPSKIKLSDGFKVKSNTRFKAAISPCGTVVAGGREEEQVVSSEDLTVAGTSTLVYPNPSGEGVFRLAVLDKSPDLEVEIVNMVGSKIKTIKSTENVTEIDLSGEADGIYLAKVNKSSGVETFKLIYQR